MLETPSIPSLLVDPSGSAVTMQGCGQSAGKSLGTSVKVPCRPLRDYTPSSWKQALLALGHIYVVRCTTRPLVIGIEPFGSASPIHDGSMSSPSFSVGWDSGHGVIERADIVGFGSSRRRPAGFERTVALLRAKSNVLTREVTSTQKAAFPEAQQLGSTFSSCRRTAQISTSFDSCSRSRASRADDSITRVRPSILTSGGSTCSRSRTKTSSSESAHGTQGSAVCSNSDAE